MPPDPHVHTGVAAWTVDDGRLLMIRRGGSGPFASDGHGTWSVPGGWLDRGEDPLRAAVRETLEETGADVAPIGEAGWVHGTSDDGTFDIVTLVIVCHWLGKVEPHVTEPDKCPEVRWVPLADVPSLPLFAPAERIWHKLDVEGRLDGIAATL